MIDIIRRSPSGLWTGSVGGRVGEFKFILVEEERGGVKRLPRPPCHSSPYESLDALLRSVGLGHLLQVGLKIHLNKKLISNN